eukprot:c38837_g1_i1 orf=228-1196(+)
MEEEIPVVDAAEHSPEAWLLHLKEEAIQRGISRMVAEKALHGIRLSQQSLKQEQNQPEVKASFKAYLNRMVNENRILKGVAALRDHQLLLEDISSAYGVPASVLIAIWGVESSYGAFTGKCDTIQALVTLGFGCQKPRRAKYFREEIMHALTIMEKGIGPLGDEILKGSWAGAMGQCQFMPSSFLSYAVDYDGDNHADIWESHADVLASIANYLNKHGWKQGFPFAVKVSVPETVETSVLGLGVTKTVTEWSSEYGVHVPDEEKLSLQNEIASLVAPDGLQGSTYLVFDNFKSVMSYNVSLFYSLSVYELSHEIANRNRQGE